MTAISARASGEGSGRGGWAALHAVLMCLSNLSKSSWPNSSRSSAVPASCSLIKYPISTTFETRVVPLVEVEDETVSSTHIRGLIAAGDVERAGRFLGAPFMLEGEVVGGDRRGRDLGFPTANIVPADHLAHPGHGVYAAWAHGHMAAVNVGVRPTFETGRGLLVEAYLIDFDADLYGEVLRIAFARRLRGERRFESAEALVEQMERDVEDARRVLAG